MFIFRTENECPEKRTFIHSNLIVLLDAIVVIDEFLQFTYLFLYFLINIYFTLRISLLF